MEEKSESRKIKNNRIKYLKETKKIATKYLEENKSIKSESKGWRLDVVENNIQQLKKIITGINKSLHEKALQNYVELELELNKRQSNLKFENSFNPGDYGRKMGEGLMHFKLLRFSPSYSIVHDLYWIEDGTVGDQISIATGEKSPDILSQFLKDKVKYAEKEILPYLLKDEKYKSVYDVFKASIFESKQKSYLVSNILLITGIESLVRLLAKFIYTNQNPNLSDQDIDHYIFKNFLSLEGLINKGDWKEDLYIKLADAIVMNEYIFDESIEKAEEKRKKHIEAQEVIKEMIGEMAVILKPELSKGKEEEAMKKAMVKLEEIKDFTEKNIINTDEENIGVSFKTNLQFLLRGYKEDRNQLIHGNFEKFNKGWKNYIYFSALKKVFLLLKKYNAKYKTV